MAKPRKLPSGKWQIRWFDADNERQSATFATYDLARAELRRLEVSVDEDHIRRERLGSGALTVAVAGQAYLDGLKRSPQDTERRFNRRKDQHETAFTFHIKPYLSDVRLCDLTPKVLRGWIETLVAKKTGRPGEKNAEGRTLSASTIRTVVVTLRQIAKANDIPLHVMLAEPLKQKRRKSRPRALQCIEDVRALLAACRDPWFKIAAAIACYCGARLGEVASLRWRHVSDKTITLALSWEGPLKARYDDGEEAARVVVLAPELAVILKAWREQTNGEDNDRVVLVGGKRPLREGYDDVAAKTRAACKRAGVTELTFHQLRHTYGTIAAGQGLPLPYLQALLGHADMKTTSIYVHSDSERAALDPRARLGGNVMATPENDHAEMTN